MLYLKYNRMNILNHNLHYIFLLLFYYSSLVIIKILWADRWKLIFINYHTTTIFTSYNYWLTKLQLRLSYSNYKWERYPFWISFLTTINKLYVKGDQAYTCNLQPWITIFSRLYFIMRFALCRHILTWHILHVLRINKYIILWRVKYQMWRCQLRVLTSSVLIDWFAWHLISLGLTPAYDILPHNGSHSYSLKGVMLRKL